MKKVEPAAAQASQSRQEILSMIMAGGKGERLYPLTLERTKPSVPFGGKYRIIDFALSNFINSGIYAIYVLVQYKSQSLIEHIRTTWNKGGMLSKHFITTVPPQMRVAKEWYRGTADSIYQNINLVYDFKPRFVAIFGGDHIYRMNITDMVDFHISKKAHATVATIPVPAVQARHFGIVKTSADGRITHFCEKPVMGGSREVLASMGNYIFDAEYLTDALEADARKKTNHDFGKDIIPQLIAQRGSQVYAYDFSKNKIPGLRVYEDADYWRDVGTISSYWESNMDLLGAQPKLVLDNAQWPVYASNFECPPSYIAGSVTENCLICEGAHIQGSTIKNSIIGRSVKIEEGSHVEDSIIMDFSQVGAGSCVRKAIVDRFAVLPKQSVLQQGKKRNSALHYDESGIVVTRRGSRKAYYF